MKMRLNLILMVVLVIFLSILVTGCSTTAYRFADAEPVTQYNDTRPIPVPKEDGYDRIDYLFKVLVRRPAVEVFDVSLDERAKDVNSMDDVPASSWYTPRLGYQDISPEELLAGPVDVGPPQLPLTVIKAKTGGNPGFIAADARGKRYIIKFDPPEFPAIETTTALVVNRLFWGFGYNVPEDYLVYLRPDDIKVEKNEKLTRADVDEILRQVAPPVDGVYRSTASLFLAGTILGAIQARGVRKDDSNDTIPHEDRRELRGIRVFGGFVNHADSELNSMLDVYVGERGEGYVKHYLIDFGEAFGGHGAEKDRLWDGFSHYFDWGQMGRNFVTLGFVVEDWENLQYSQWKSIGAFESEVFQPEDWRETYQYEPVRRSQPDDDYWAAKIVGALTRDHIETLILAADYPDPEAAQYMIDTLMERRRKVLEYFMAQVTSVEALELADGQLHLQDVGKTLTEETGKASLYEIGFYSDAGEEIASRTTIETDKTQFRIAIPDSLLNNAYGYLRVDVQDEGKPRATQFHIRARKDGSPGLSGVVH